MPSPSTQANPRNLWSTLAGPWTLLILSLVAYAPTLRAPFIFDDTAAVLHNPTIRKLWSLAALNPPADGGTTTGRPLVNLTLALNHALSGTDTWSYHATNLALHLLATLALFGVLRRTQALAPAQIPAGVPFLAALLWSLHPLQTETVACIAQRTESLCALFYLSTLYAFARGWRKASVVACLLGMASKEVMVTAPLLVFLYDRTFVAGSFAGAWRERHRYYAALAATWLLLLYLVLRHSGARGSAAGFGLGVTSWTYLLTQCEAITRYLLLSVWPHPLVVDYGNTTVTHVSAVVWQGLFIVTLLGVTTWMLARRPRIGFACAGFFLVLAPSSSFVPLVTQTIAEHRMYLPLAALCVGFALLLARVAGAKAPAILLTIAFLAGGLTFARAHLYRSPVALWQHDIAHRPHARSITALGVALLHGGHPAEALPLFDRALALDPTHLAAQRNRALALLHIGRATEAGTILAALPAREPGEADEFFALGNAFAREQKFAEAAAAYARTVTLDPDRIAARANLGNALLLSGRPAEAIAHYEDVLRRQPGDTRAAENLQLAREALRTLPPR